MKSFKQSSIFAFAFCAALLVFSFALKVSAQERGMTRCTVVDPTGTLLNVRASPNGKEVVSKLKKGTSVFIEDYRADERDREWVLLRLTGRKVNKSLGWVLSEFLDCE